jgi:hypothetical protein
MYPVQLQRENMDRLIEISRRLILVFKKLLKMEAVGVMVKTAGFGITDLIVKKSQFATSFSVIIGK